MYRSTYGDLLTTRFPVSLNIRPSDPRCAAYANSAIQRLLPRGHWIGTVQTYSVRTDSHNVQGQTFTLPPQFAAMEGIAVCRRPISMRPWWYMWNGSGWGITKSSDTTGAADQAQMLGNYCTFADLPATGTQIRMQCDLAADVGKQVIVLGEDGNGNWIRTVQGGDYADGEVITLAQSPGTLSVNQFARITDIQFPTTLNADGLTVPSRKGQVWLYSWVSPVNTLIGVYQWFETRPSYRRYAIPIIANTTPTSPIIDIVGKLTFVPVANPNDYLIVPNLEAVRLAACAIKCEEEHLYDEAAILMEGKRDPNTHKIIREGAITILEDELAHYNGDAEQPSLQITGQTDFGCPIETLL